MKGFFPRLLVPELNGERDELALMLRFDLKRSFKLLWFKGYTMQIHKAFS